MIIKVTKRIKRGINCYGEKYTAKYTTHNYMDGERVICAVEKHVVYESILYYFIYPWSITNENHNKHILRQDYKTLAEAQERAEYYLTHCKSNLYIK